MCLKVCRPMMIFSLIDNQNQKATQVSEMNTTAFLKELLAAGVLTDPF